jgi:hypothetical protein
MVRARMRPKCRSLGKADLHAEPTTAPRAPGVDAVVARVI